MSLKLLIPSILGNLAAGMIFKVVLWTTHNFNPIHFIQTKCSGHFHFRDMLNKHQGFDREGEENLEVQGSFPNSL